MPTLRTKVPGYPRYSSHLLMSMNVKSGYASKVMGYSPIAYYKLDETSGIQAKDSSGNALHAEYKNSPALNNAAGPGASMGNAPLFDGSNDFVQLPAAGLNSVFNGDTGTLGMWINLNEAWTTLDIPMLFAIGADATHLFQIYKDNSNQLTFLRKATATQFTTRSFSSTGWHHILTTWSVSGGFMRLYADGVKSGADLAISGAWSSVLADAYSQIGAANGSNTWKGWLAHFCLFDSVLTAPKITDLATAV